MWRSKVNTDDLYFIFTFNKHNYKLFNNVVLLITVLLAIYMYEIILIVYGMYLCCMICAVDIYLFINLFFAGCVNVF